MWLIWKFDEWKKVKKSKNWSQTHTDTRAFKKKWKQSSRKSCDQVKRRKTAQLSSELFRSTLSTRLLSTRENESIGRTNGVCVYKIQSTFIYHFSIGVLVSHLCMCLCVNVCARALMYSLPYTPHSCSQHWADICDCRRHLNQKSKRRPKTKQNTLNWAIWRFVCRPCIIMNTIPAPMA